MIELFFQNPILYLMMVVSVVLALSVHEYVHAQVADFLGDHTARDEGRLTVNPLKHFDPLGTFFLFVIGFGWGRPVPFSPLNLKNKRWGPPLIALSGPASNFFLALAVGLVLRFSLITNPGMINFFTMFVWLNIVLGVFNLLPIPPLDGSHLFLAILPQSWENIKIGLLGGGVFYIILAVLFMRYIAAPFICRPLFVLITGAPIF